jgi:uncharacterized protein (DUF2236 family)
MTKETDDRRASLSPATLAVNGERMAILGWGRAILLQLAHPLVAAGVHEHSRFRGSLVAPVARLHGTIRAMLAFSFGSQEQAAQAAAIINGIHDRVHGRLPHAAGPFPAGTLYSAKDPQLLLWVHLTLLDSVTLAYSRFVEPLADEAIGAYCRDSTRSTALLGIAASSVPASRAELEGALLRYQHQLCVTDAARELAQAIVTPPLTGRLPGFRLHRLATIGLLPAAVRNDYGLPWSAGDEQALRRWTARLRTYSRRAPAVLRRWRAARRLDG